MIARLPRLARVAAGLLALSVACVQAGAAFVHPGILHNQADLDRLKSKTGIEPYKTACAAFKATRWAQSTYVPNPVVDETYGVGKFQIRDDSRAAYYNAIMWQVTGATAHRDKAKSIINAWVTTLKTFDVTDHLSAGPAALYFSNAAEIIRHKGGGWSAAEIAGIETWLIDKLLPPLLTPGGNLAADTLEAVNHGTTQIYGLIALGIFCNRQDIFDFAVNSYRKNNAGLTYGINQYIHSSGQNYESQRDQGHATGGAGNYAFIAEMAYKQGVDLYGAFSNRLHAGIEHISRFNMMWDVAPVTWTAPDGTTHNSVTSLARKPRNNPGILLAYNHYANRRGISMPRSKTCIDLYYPYSSFGEYFLYMTNASGSRPIKPTSFGEPAPTDVVLFAESGFGGRFAVHFNVGTYTTSSLVAAGVIDNQASSVKVPRGWKVTLYDGANLDGASVVLTSNSQFLGQVSFNDKTSSMKVENTGGSTDFGVTFCTETNYSGSSINRGPGYYDAANMGVPNDSITSLKIPSGYIVVLWDADKHADTPLDIYQGSVPDLGSGVAKKTSSFLVIKNF